MKYKEFAVVKWNVEDIQTITPDWSDEKCVDFLKQYQDIIRERMIETGWDVIEQFIHHDERKI